MEQVPEKPISQLMGRKEILNAAIAIQMGLGIFAGHWIEKHLTKPYWWTALVPIALCAWAAWLTARDFRSSSDSVPMHRRLEPGHYFRLFFVLLGSCQFMAAHKGGFWIYTVLAAGMAFWLVMVLCTEVIQGPQRLTPLVLGCGFFLFCLFRWEHGALSMHYGVPIIGHFLERPEYDAKYYVKVGWRDADPAQKAIADLHVKWKSEDVDTGEDRFGMSTSTTFTSRDIEIKKLIFPTGTVQIVEQYENIQNLGQEVTVEDKSGEQWRVELLKEVVH